MQLIFLCAWILATAGACLVARRIGFKAGYQAGIDHSYRLLGMPSSRSDKTSS